MFVFSEPYEAGNGTVLVTVSRQGRNGRVDQPVGIYTVRADSTSWTPAVDSNRHLTIASWTGFVAAGLATLAVLRRPPWPEMTEQVMVALAEARARSLRV